MEIDPYKTLKVAQDADIEVITAAYKALSKKYHPDINKSPDAVTRMQEINQAYDALKDPAERAKLDAKLSKSRTTSSNTSSSPGSRPSSSYSGSYTPPRRPTPSPPPSSGSNPFNDIGDKVKKAWESRARPAEPDASTFYLYQKRLVDDNQNKVLRVSAYHDRINGKVCNIYASAPDVRGMIQTGSAFLQSLELYDVIDAVGEALSAITNPGSPIEMSSDYDTYFRRKINGLSNTFVGVEVIKYARSENKICLLSVGERRGAIEGVASPQTEKQLRQVQRILEEAFRAIR